MGDSVGRVGGRFPRECPAKPGTHTRIVVRRTIVQRLRCDTNGNIIYAMGLPEITDARPTCATCGTITNETGDASPYKHDGLSDYRSCVNDTSKDMPTEEQPDCSCKARDLGAPHPNTCDWGKWNTRRKAAEEAKA